MLFRFWVFPDCTFLDISKLIYEITQKLLRRAEQTTPDIPGSIYSLGSIDYVNLVMQNDEVSN